MSDASALGTAGKSRKLPPGASSAQRPTPLAMTPFSIPRRLITKKSGNIFYILIFFGWVFFLNSSGSPHVRPMGSTCGEPTEIELTPIGVKLDGSRRVHVPADLHRRRLSTAF